MKIVCLVTNDLIQDQRMHRICTSLCKLFDEVVLLGREKTHSQAVLPMPFRQVRLQLKYQSGVSFYWVYNTEAFKFLKDEQPDVVYAVDLDTLIAAGRYVSRSGCKFIYDAHEYFTEVPELAGKWLKKKIWTAVGKSYIPQAHLAITVNNSLQDILAITYNRHFEVIRNVPRLKPTPREADRKRIVLYQGVLNEGRGLEQAILACAEMDWLELWIAGEGDRSQALRDLAVAKNKYDNIRFLGWQNPEELARLTQQAWVGLNLLEGTSLNYKYSLANKFFDYMHAGVPSINMQFPEYESINAELPVAINIPDLNQETIQIALERLVNEQLYTELSANAQSLSEKYNWQNEEEKFTALIHKIL